MANTPVHQIFIIPTQIGNTEVFDGILKPTPMAPDDRDTINSQKISYLLELMGRSRLARESSEADDSDYEDIPDNPDITANMAIMLQQSALVPDTYQSATTKVQESTETSIRAIYDELVNEAKMSRVITNDPFERNLHLSYVSTQLTTPFNLGFFVLDANHSWMLYWLVNSHNIILESPPLDASIADGISRKINTLIVDDGAKGIAGGAHQLGHIASTYAAILVLVSAKDYVTLSRIRHNLYKWLLTLKRDNGSFVMHQGGESDTRSTYCALVIASLLNVMTEELTTGVLAWLNSCQTYEGGFAGTPNAEAHGGYTFCAFASYYLLLGEDKSPKQFGEEVALNIDLNSLVRWSAMRQFQIEGGFSGRSNKLVDACYSFWVGALFPLLESVINVESLFNRDALKTYILNCAQNSTNGGFRDKPGKSVDFYHTNYTLAGLSISEYYISLLDPKFNSMDALAYSFAAVPVNVDHVNTNAINPVFCLPLGVAEDCKLHFSKI